jgi:peptide chain release factor 2
VEDDFRCEALDQFEQDVEAGEIKKMLGGEHDRKNAIVTIHPGAGGTESQDWASMLLRMFQRFADPQGVQEFTILDFQAGEEAGIKSAMSALVTGDYAYGTCKSERGVHRLVRISRSTRQRAATPASPRSTSGPN